MSSAGLTTNISIAEINGQTITTSNSLISSAQGSAITGQNADLIYYNSAQAFQMSATGLKPNTVHKFTFDNLDVSAYCQPSGKNLGDALITDSNGSINFTYFYNVLLGTYNTDLLSGGINTSLFSSLAAAQTLINSVTGNEVGTLSNSDGTSTAQITVYFYTGGTNGTAGTSTPSSLTTTSPAYIEYGGFFFS